MVGAFQKTIRELLSGRDWIYLLSLLVPLTVYNLTLKAMSIAIKDDAPGLWGSLDLMRSDILFNVGYGILWVGLFAVARRGALRKVAVVFFHVISLLIVTVSTVAYQYFEGTGSTLDYSVITFYLSTLGEVKEIIASEAAWYVWLGLILALLYAALGPWAITRLAARRSHEGTARTSRLEAAGLCLIAVGIASLSMVPGAENSDRSFSLSPLTNVLITGIAAPGADELEVEKAGASVSVPLTDVKLKETPRTEKRNVVLIHLESTRERSVTPYNPDLQTTPFLDELSKKSLLVERAYTTTPHTSKALTSINCGIYPDPSTDIHEAEPGGVPVKCLPELLKEQGYNTVMFQSAIATFENRPQLAKNFGYEDFVGLKEMSKKGFQRSGYLGYEDDILLKPSEEWLTSHKDRPFMASYIGITPHHEYLAPTRYGRVPLAKDDVLNRYLNAVRYDDFWIKNLIEQYKKLGLYKNTIFIIYGDHGEAFGEHGVKGHDGVVYEEGLRVPLIIHDPQRWQNGAKISADAPIHHIDLPPTILDMLHYRVVNGDYPGASALKSPEGRTLYFNCRPDLQCMASIKGYQKYIYYYGKQPDEFYDLKNDPLEKHNIIGQIPPAELDQRRNDLLEWRSHAAAEFEKAPSKSK
ncbi:MAG TPA: sulfatase-like hydrolase/transferase [Rubrobacteraceae bacterium]|nr:sulfatase-like hydrolase/transferase [Rubrobacteraceae bacterium]